MKKLLLFPIVPALLFSCSNSVSTAKQTEKTSQLADSSQVFQPELINGLKVPILTHVIHSDKNELVTLASGTKIHIPSNAFLDTKGNPVSGDVQLHWQEFQTLPEIMLSGLPMTYDSCGVQHHFESGGMFTITASQDEEQLQLAKGKSISIDLISINEQKKFNFYSLNADGSWKYETTAAGKDLKTEGTDKPLADKAMKSNSHILDISLDVSHLDELKNTQILGWKPTRELTLKERNSLNLANFSANLERTETNGIYQLTCKNSRESYTFEVSPYTFTQAANDSKCNEQDQVAENKETVDFLTRVEQGKVVRTIAINNLGTHNWDCVKNLERFVICDASLNLENSTFNQRTMTKYFYVSPDENLLVSLSNEHTKIYIPKRSKACVIAILPTNEIAICNSFQLRQAAGKIGNEPIQLFLKKTKKTVASPEQIGELIQQLI